MFDVKLPNIKWLEERGSMEHILKADPSKEQGLIMLYGPSNFTRWTDKKWGMVPAEEVEPRTGHSVGGVCPFGVNDGVDVWLDVSLRRYETVFPACGSSPCIRATSSSLMMRMKSIPLITPSASAPGTSSLPPL